MIIIKKSGKEEEFSADKLLCSISAASDEVKKPLNESDLKVFLANFQKILEGKTSISTCQIEIIVFGLLYEMGCTEILENYAAYSRNRK